MLKSFCLVSRMLSILYAFSGDFRFYIFKNKKMPGLCIILACCNTRSPLFRKRVLVEIIIASTILGAFSLGGGGGVDTLPKIVIKYSRSIVSYIVISVERLARSFGTHTHTHTYTNTACYYYIGIEIALFRLKKICNFI